MNQKEKIIIGLTSLLCGSPIVFLAWKKNNHQPKKKNRLSSKKKENKENNEDSSSFLFWISFTVFLLLIATIILLAIYKYYHNSEKVPETKKLEFDDDPKGSVSENKKLIEDPFLKEKNSFQGYLVYDQKTENLTIYIGKNPDKFNQQSIEDIFQADIAKQSPLLMNPNFYQNIKKKKMKIILRTMTDFLKIYLTSKLLDAVQNALKTTFYNYEILADIVKHMNKSVNKEPIELYVDQTKYEEMEYPEAKNLITGNNYIILLKSCFAYQNAYQKIIFVKDSNNDQRYLFKNLCRFKFFIDNLYQSLLIFMEYDKKKYQNSLKLLKKNKQIIDTCAGVISDD